MNQSVLVNTDINESAEVNNISDRSFQLHAGLEILHIHNICTEHRRWKLITRIAAGAHKLLSDILHCRDTYADFFGNLFFAESGNLFAEIADFVFCGVIDCVAADFKQSLCGGIAFRVNTRVIKKIFALRYAHEAGTLLKCLCAELWHFFELRPRSKFAVFLTVSDNIFCNGRVDSGNPCQK